MLVCAPNSATRYLRQLEWEGLIERIETSDSLRTSYFALKSLGLPNPRKNRKVADVRWADAPEAGGKEPAKPAEPPKPTKPAGSSHLQKYLKRLRHRKGGGLARRG